MRPVVLTLMIALGSTPAFAADAPAVEKTWTGKAGACSDWTLTWKMTKTDDQQYRASGGTGDFYKGTVEQAHTGGPCWKDADWTMAGTAEASIEGSAIKAIVHLGKNDDVCTYEGQIDGDQVKDGFRTCLSAQRQPWQMKIAK